MTSTSSSRPSEDPSGGNGQLAGSSGHPRLRRRNADCPPVETLDRSAKSSAGEDVRQLAVGPKSLTATRRSTRWCAVVRVEAAAVVLEELAHRVGRRTGSAAAARGSAAPGAGDGGRRGPSPARSPSRSRSRARRSGGSATSWRPASVRCRPRAGRRRTPPPCARPPRARATAGGSARRRGRSRPGLGIAEQRLGQGGGVVLERGGDRQVRPLALEALAEAVSVRTYTPMRRVGYPSSARRSFRTRCSRPCIDSWPMNPSTSSRSSGSWIRSRTRSTERTK